MIASGGASVEKLPAGLPEGLARVSAYPGDASARDGVQWVQTHLSHVFLTGERVYKLRKAVDLGFVDFSTRALRNQDCLREVALNRRLAPDVYLGVAPVEGGGTPHVGPLAEALAPCGPHGATSEHCVVMRRLPDGRDALSLLQAGRLRSRHLDAVAARIARFHEAARLGVPAPFSPEAWRARLWAPVEETLGALASEAGGARVSRVSRERVLARARSFFDDHADRFEARRRDGRAVDGHGDLHLQHVWFESEAPEPLFVDCIEFREDLRRIDAAAEVAFLAMDLTYRRRRRFAARFLRRYARESDDFDLYGVVDFYVSYRAAVRAKVAALAAGEPEIAPVQRAASVRSARRHLALAERALAPRRRGALVLLTGIIGTGKSSAAELVADELEGVVIASDRVRKRLAGLPLTAPFEAGMDPELYGPERVEAVYGALLPRAAPVVDSGRVAVLDASYDRASRRAAARRWAQARGVPFWIVETRCAEPVVLARLARRRAAGQDPSDAGPELYRAKAAQYESVEADAPGEHVVIHTDAAGWRTRARKLARRLAGSR